ncbi:MAG: hypothetical protein KIT22_11545 [Verrucomicrobiae bacterium]|nr:hypothetical protein [Verrucomicrobiae bacterium]
MATVLTPGERRALALVLFLVVSGLAAQWWLRSHPPADAASLSSPADRHAEHAQGGI